MEDLSLHILDIVENSIAAQAQKISIRIHEYKEQNTLSLEIEDNGNGMDEETLSKALDPFFTSRKERRFGFGLSLLAEAARATEGTFSIDSKPGKGTQIRAVFHTDHIDVKPLGDIPQTIITLIMGNPGVDFLYRHDIDGKEYTLDTREIKEQINGVPVNSPEVLQIIKKNLKEGLENLRR